MHSAASEDLAAAFAAHADETLKLANQTFPAAAEVWLRECAWPACLSDAQSARLVAEIEHVEIYGVELPGRVLYDKRAECGCVEA